MDEGHSSQVGYRKTLHSKRSFKHNSATAVDSPLYDASEEDNDETGDDVSMVSTSSPHHHHNPRDRRETPSSPLAPNRAIPQGTPGNKVPRPAAVSKAQATQDSDGMDSPTYDGDIESSTTIAGSPTKHTNMHAHQLSTSTLADTLLTLSSLPLSSSASSMGEPDGSSVQTPATPVIPLASPPPPVAAAINPAINVIPPRTYSKDTKLVVRTHHELAVGEPEPTDATMQEFDPSALTPDEIAAFIKDALEGTGSIPRHYKPNPPPVGRPVRIYADGVYDVFHFGHSLQLRQAKLSFPAVHLLVGVCSDELCSQHKSRTVMNHAERCESVRHCRWVDEVVSDAPWVINQAFLDKHRIDYVAHDEDPYAGSDGSADVYDYVKKTGRFIPTRRTPGVSTSELLERIVSGYRKGEWDAKLEKIGHPELKAEGSDWGGSVGGRSPRTPSSPV